MKEACFTLLRVTAVALVHSTASAAVESVTCFDESGRTAKVIEFDASRQTVRMDGRQMGAVKVTGRYISFAHDLGVGGLWPIRIDRVTGLMARKIPGDERPGIPTHLPPLKCEKTKKQF